MATTSKFPTGNATATGVWTNGTTGLNADDGTNATFTTTTKNDSRNLLVGTFGFLATIPAGSVINSVSVEVQEQVTSGGTLRTVIERAGVAGANNDNTTDTALTVRTFSSLARPGGGSWVRDDLSDANLKVRVYGLQPNNTTSRAYTYDYVKVIVDYTPPVTATSAQSLPALTQDASAQHGTPVAASSAQSLPALTQDADGVRESNLGSAAQVLPALTQQAAGTRAPTTAQASSVLPALTTDATGAIPTPEAAVASVLPALQQTATGTRAPTTAQGTSTLPALTQDGTGERGLTTGTVGSYLPALAQAATGERGPNGATATSPLPSLTQSAQGERAATEAQAANALPALTQQVLGTFGDIITGPISNTLPALTQAASGMVEAPEASSGSIAITLPALSSISVARIVVMAEAGSLLPALVQFATQTQRGIPVEGPTKVTVTIKSNQVVVGGNNDAQTVGAPGHSLNDSENGVIVWP